VRVLDVTSREPAEVAQEILALLADAR